MVITWALFFRQDLGRALLAGLSSSFLCDSDSQISSSFRDELTKHSKRSGVTRLNASQGRSRPPGVRSSMTGLGLIFLAVSSRCWKDLGTLSAGSCTSRRVGGLFRQFLARGVNGVSQRRDESHRRHTARNIKNCTNGSNPRRNEALLR